MNIPGTSFGLTRKVESFLKEASLVILFPCNIDKYLVGEDKEEREVGYFDEQLELLLKLSVNLAEDGEKMVQILDYVSISVANLEIEGAKSVIHLLGENITASLRQIKTGEAFYQLSIKLPNRIPDAEKARYLCKFQLVFSTKANIFPLSLQTTVQREIDQINKQNSPFIPPNQLLIYTRLVKCSLEIVNPFVLVVDSFSTEKKEPLSFDLQAQLDLSLTTVSLVSCLNSNQIDSELNLSKEFSKGDLIHLLFNSFSNSFYLKVSFEINKTFHSVLYDLKTYFHSISLFNELQIIEQLKIETKQIESKSDELVEFNLTIFNLNAELSCKIELEIESKKDFFIPLQNTISLPEIFPVTGTNVSLKFIKLLTEATFETNLIVRNIVSNKAYLMKLTNSN